MLEFAICVGLGILVAAGAGYCGYWLGCRAMVRAVNSELEAYHRRQHELMKSQMKYVQHSFEDHRVPGGQP